MSEQEQKRISRKGRKHKFDPAIVEKLADANLPQSEISKLVGVHPASISRFLKKLEIHKREIEELSKLRADGFSERQARLLALGDSLIEDLASSLSQLSWHQKIGLLQASTLGMAVAFDKERLELGKSNLNVSSLTQIVVEAHRHEIKREGNDEASG